MEYSGDIMDYWLGMKAVELKLEDSKALELKEMSSDPSPITSQMCNLREC